MQRRQLAWLVGASLLIAACQTVPYTNRRHLLLISAGEETQLGIQAYQETLKKAKLSTGSEKVSMIRRVGHRLAQAANKPDFQWEFNLIEDDKQINAFCLPGGKVAVYTGILPVTQTETGMAVVMGHEIAHAVARHGGERMSQGMLAQFGGQALSVALSQQPAATQQLYSQAYGIGVGVGVLLPFSRAQESEADHIGLIFMAKAGYEPKEAVDFWGRMKKATGDKGNDPLGKYLRTHPTDEKRIEDIRKWLPEAESHLKKDDGR